MESRFNPRSRRARARRACQRPTSSTRNAQRPPKNRALMGVSMFWASVMPAHANPALDARCRAFCNRNVLLLTLTDEEKML